MRKSIIILLLFSIFMVNGCGTNKTSESSQKLKWMQKKNSSSKEKADEFMEYLITALNEKRTDDIIALLSDSALKIEDKSIYQEEIEAMYSYLNNDDIITFDSDNLPPASTESNERGKKSILYTGFYKFFTAQDTYWVVFDLCIRNDENPEEIGLTRIIIASNQVKEKEDFSWLYYRDPPGFYTIQ